MSHIPLVIYSSAQENRVSSAEEEKAFNEAENTPSQVHTFKKKKKSNSNEHLWYGKW